jgi:hypothetical protein
MMADNSTTSEAFPRRALLARVLSEITDLEMASKDNALV